MTVKDISKFSATAALTGYLYQCRLALLESLRRLRKGSELTVSLETLDDVVFEKQGEAPELLQAKHHLNKAADLTDASPDIWKTLRVWAEGFGAGNVPIGTTFFLITTASAPEGTAAYYLKTEDGKRSIDKALERLNGTAESSINKTNVAAYSAFRSLSSEQKKQLLSSAYVMDAAPSIIDLEASFREELFYTVELKYLTSLLHRLEGWWFRRAIQHLVDDNSKPILSEEILDETTRLREQFKQDSLPIDDDILSATIDESGYHNKTFVQQLKLIEIGNKRIFHAVRNFFRAFEQRSRWVREDLLLVGELGRYEDKLIEEWEIKFEQMKEELGNDAAEDAKKQAAQTMYKWVETGALASIRSGCTEPFIARGTYQMLADDKRVGWHPEFMERLRHLLEPEEAK